MKTTHFHFSRLLLAVGALVVAASPAHAALIGRLDGTYPVGGVASQTVAAYQRYCFQSTATSSSTLLSLMFRNDPSFTSLDNVSVVKTGTSLELLLNGGFDANVNGPIPDHWLAVGVQGLQAAGHLVSSGGNGFWYDGAVGGFDGIAQVVATTPGDTYTICFDLRGNPAFNATTVVTEVYFGDLPPGTVITGTGTMPEPSAAMLLGLSVSGLLLRRRRAA
jgi:hypothetical protein